MKKQGSNTNYSSTANSVGKDKFSRVLLIGAIILYSASLILLANLAWANTSNVGALIKVNQQLDGDAFADLNAKVKSVCGNVLAIDMSTALIPTLQNVKGLCSSHVDNMISKEVQLMSKEAKAKYAGTGVVIGILDNSGTLSSSSISELKKTELSANIGFISYVSDNPNSTVIMRNLKGGESNLIQALLYMEEYAKTVEKPLVVELNVSERELNNLLFVQVCQKFADAGVQFLGTTISSGVLKSNAPVQLAFSMFNAETGQITDQSDFWAIEEVKEQQILLLGSDENTCAVHFQTESGFDKVYLSNGSEDLVMVTAITADGSVNYYHVTHKETALIPRDLLNGTPILEDGLSGIYPYHSKGILFNGAVASRQFVSLGSTQKSVEMGVESGLAMTVGSPTTKTLAVHLQNISPNLEIEIKDEFGTTVYRNQPDKQTQSIRTKIDLSSSDGGLYFLDLTSPDFHQTFALLMD